MLYRLARIASYNQASCIEESSGHALVQIGGERKKFSLSEVQTKSYAAGDIVRVDGKLALIIMREPPNNFILLVGKLKKELTLINGNFLPFASQEKGESIVDDEDVTNRIQWNIPPLNKEERRQRAYYLINKYKIHKVHAFDVIDGKMSLPKALLLKCRNEKRQGEIELKEMGIPEPIIKAYRDDEISIEEAKEIHQKNEEISKIKLSPDDIYIKGKRLSGSFGSSSK